MKYVNSLLTWGVNDPTWRNPSASTLAPCLVSFVYVCS